MPIIFGWGKQTIKIIGATFKNKCNFCHNEEYWVLKRIITWFTLFFIPVIPYSYKYFLSCPICERGIYLDGEQLKTFKPLAETNQLLIEGKISTEEYARRLGQPEAITQKTTSTEEIALETKSVKITAPKFCRQCGLALNKTNKFCGNCGYKII